MKRTTRLTAGLVAAVAVAAPSAFAAAQAAEPAPTVKAQTKQLLKDIAGKDKRLARLSTSNAVVSLADDTEAALVANLGEARTDLGEIKSAAEAADTTLDTRAARKDLRAFRVENFRIVVNILKKAEGLEEAAAADPEATAHLAEAEAAALEITAASTKADIRAVREHIQLAEAELEPETETETTTA